MTSLSALAETGALIGDPARANMLVALMDGRALTAGELARAAGITPATASAHLARLCTARLLTVLPQGRHRYYRLADPGVGAMLESMMATTARLQSHASARPPRVGPRDRALRRARVCYDHLAGEIAVGIADSLASRGAIDRSEDGAAVTESGLDFLGALGVELPPAGSGRRVFCRPCLDWSERRPHLAGAVGAGLYRFFLSRHWMRRSGDSRIVTLSPAGVTGLEKHFGIRVDA